MIFRTQFNNKTKPKDFCRFLLLPLLLLFTQLRHFCVKSFVSVRTYVESRVDTGVLKVLANIGTTTTTEEWQEVIVERIS